MPVGANSISVISSSFWSVGITAGHERSWLDRTLQKRILSLPHVTIRVSSVGQTWMRIIWKKLHEQFKVQSDISIANANDFDSTSFISNMFATNNSYWSAGKCSGSEGRFYDGHDREVKGSTPIQALLLSPWLICFTIIILSWWNLTSSKLRSQKQNAIGKFGNKATPKQAWIRPMYGAAVALSWQEKNEKIKKYLCFHFYNPKKIFVLSWCLANYLPPPLY